MRARVSPIRVASVTLLALGLLLDVLTPAALVVSILLNIPIALSALALSKRFTLSLVALALAANVLAGLFNGLSSGGWDAVALANRGFSALSYLLVGLLTTRLSEASARVALLAVQERRAETEERLRALAQRVSGPHAPREVLARAAAGLRDVLNAREVVVGAVRGGALMAPLAAEPPAGAWAPGGPLPADWLAVPAHGPAAFGDADVLVGRWRRREGEDLLVLAFGAASGDAALLERALRVLEPQLDTAVLLAEVRAGQAAAQRQGAVVRDLVYAFSHDLRTPLMANLMSMRLALAGAYGELRGDYRASLESGLQANQDLLDLADKLLMVARLESGEAGQDRTPLDFGALVAERADAMRGAAPQVRLSVQTDPGLSVLGQPGELRRLVQNLIENALKWSPPDGEVRVDVTADGADALLTVRDDGPGVPTEARARLFQRFRGHGAGAGSGLGLYLARRIAETHGGSIAYRRPPGERTTFEVRLPRA